MKSLPNYLQSQRKRHSLSQEEVGFLLGASGMNKGEMQFTADLTRTEIKVAEVAESSAWGAAMSGLLGLGIYRSLSDLEKLPRPQTGFFPKMPTAKATRLHKGWQSAVKRVL